MDILIEIYFVCKNEVLPSLQQSKLTINFPVQLLKEMGLAQRRHVIYRKKKKMGRGRND